MVYKDFEEYWRETFGRRSGAVPVRLGDTIKAYAKLAWNYQQKQIDSLEKQNKKLEEELPLDLNW